MENPFAVIVEQLEALDRKVDQLSAKVERQATAIPEEDRLVNLTEAAKLLGVHKNTVLNLAKKGRIQRRLVGTAVRYSRRELLAFAAERKH